MQRIESITAEEVHDSRGAQTLAVTVRVEGAAAGRFAVPSGASTGSAEALELRDKNGSVAPAIKNIEAIIAPALIGFDAADQEALDARLIELDGTAQKTHLGGNALVGVSVAAAKAAAAGKGVEVFEHLRSLARDIAPSRRVPYLYMNYINGGLHVPAQMKGKTVAFQEHLIVPDTESIDEALSIARKVDEALAPRIAARYGADAAASMGDEGGYVIPETQWDAPFTLLQEAVRTAGLEGRVRLASDIAASSFYRDGRYRIGGESLDANDLLALHQSLIARFSPLSIEDPFEEGAQADFARLQAAAPSVVLVGDDLTVTDAARIAAAKEAGAIGAVIIKPNQIGTLTETLVAMRAAREGGIDCIVSHRSGETMDDFIADLAFAFGTFGIKSGSLRRAERVVKYERLKAIASL